MKGVILAGGPGTRLDPTKPSEELALLASQAGLSPMDYARSLGIDESKPKALQKFAGMPMIYQSVGMLIDAGVKDILVACSKENVQQIAEELGDGRKWGVNIKCEAEKERRGDINPLLEFPDFFKDDSVMVIASDNYIDWDARRSDLRMISERYSNGNLNTKPLHIVGVQVPDVRRFGMLNISSSNRIISITEKPKLETAAPGIVKAGIYVFTPPAVEIAKQTWEQIQQRDAKKEFGSTDVFNNWLAAGGVISFNNIGIAGETVGWGDLGTYTSYAEAESYAKLYHQKHGYWPGDPQVAANMRLISQLESDTRLSDEKKAVRTLLNSTSPHNVRGINKEVLNDYLHKCLLPQWVKHGVDFECGGFFEGINEDLSAALEYKRLRSQTRQIFIFSRAAQNCEDDQLQKLYANIAQQGYDFLIANFFDKKNDGWFFSTTREGEPLDTSKSLYDHAFVLLALSEYYSLTKDPSAAEYINSTYNLLDKKFRSPNGNGYQELFNDDWSKDISPKRTQNSHMHLLEAMLRLYEVTGEAKYLERSKEIVSLFKTTFFDSEHGCLSEFFDQNLKPLGKDGCIIVEPGHIFEWASLLKKYSELSLDDSLMIYVQKLLDFATVSGIDNAYGCVYDQVDPNGGVLSTNKRLWPQAEAIKAFSSMGMADSSEAVKLTSDVLQAFIEPISGIWKEHKNRELKDVRKDHPATSLYHIYSALEALAKTRHEVLLQG